MPPDPESEHLGGVVTPGPEMREILCFSAAAIYMFIAAAAIEAQPAAGTASGGESLRLVSPWFGAGLGLGRVHAQQGDNYVEAPGPAATLHAGAEIGTRIFLGAEFYGQSSINILEDSKNSA